MKKYFLALIMALAMVNTVFAAALEDDRATMANATAAEIATVETVEPSIQRYVHVMDRLSGTMEEFVIVTEADYLPVMTELDQGDLIATCDDQVKLNLQVQVKRYSDNAVTRKMALIPINFKHLTIAEQEQHAKMEKYSIYAVEEQPVQGKSGPIIIDNNAGFENVSYFVNMLVQLKMVQ